VAEALHYAAIAAWTGMVLVSGWLVLARPALLPKAVLHGYVHRMSQWAGGAVAVIAATGIYSAWHRVGTAANLVQDDYGVTLLAKLALVAAALLLGAYNKFIGLPALAGHGQRLAAVRAVLRVESAFLAAALVAASYLTTLQPPAGNLS
jgi:copper resistance protein D